MVDPAPALLEDVVSPEWLSGAIDGLADGESVVETRVVDDYTTVLSKVRFEAVIEGPDGERTTRRYCVKGSFVPGGRIANVAVEGRFYREVGPSLGLRIPSCVYSGADERTGRSLFIMSDLVAEGATFLNSQTPYSLDLTAAALEQLAILHAGTWGEKGLRGLEWLEDNRPTMAESIPIEVVDRQINDGRADGLPDYLKDAERIREAMRRVTVPQRVCLAHGDPHSLNIYLDGVGRPGLLDWQLVHVGHWATDVGYHIAVVLDTETRRKHEEALLRGYLEDLAERGAEPPPWDEAWDQYTSHVAYGYFLWCCAAVTPRVDIVEHIPRLGAALIDHDTFARLGV